MCSILNLDAHYAMGSMAIIVTVKGTDNMKIKIKDFVKAEERIKELSYISDAHAFVIGLILIIAFLLAISTTQAGH